MEADEGAEKLTLNSDSSSHIQMKTTDIGTNEVPCSEFSEISPGTEDRGCHSLLPSAHTSVFPVIYPLEKCSVDVKKIILIR